MAQELSPTERIGQFKIEQAALLEEQAKYRTAVLNMVGSLATKYSQGVEIVRKQPTAPERKPTQSNFHTLSFEHDETPAYRVTKKDEFSTGGVEEVSWLFDTKVILPIRNIVLGHQAFDKESNWIELNSTLVEMRLRLDNPVADPLVSIQDPSLR